MVAAQFSANTIPSVFNLLKSRGAAVNTQGALILNDEVGQLQFRGSDGTNFQVTASVRAAIDGAVSAGVMPGRLIFMTTTAAGVLTERMRISQDGTILMGGFLNAANGLRLSNTTDATNGNIRFNGVGLEFYRNGWRDLSFPKYTYDDFNFPALGATANQNGFSAVIVAGGTGVLSGSGSGTNNMGIVTLGTGITNNTNGVAALDGTSSLNKIQLAGYPVTIEWRIQIPTLSTAAVNFQTRIGLQDGNAGGDPTNGVYFSYNQANNTGGWQAITRSASISTTVNSSIVVVAGTYYRIRAEINAAATNVDFYIDSGAGYVLIGSSTTNIPTAAMRPIAKINKVITATTITSIFNCDWCWWNMER